jgi:hypothetical protein
MREQKGGSDYNEAGRYAFKQIHTEGFLRFLEAAAAVRQALHQALEQNVKASTPEFIRRRIDGQTDFTTLLNWHGNAVLCTTWDEVRALIGLATT